MHLKRTFDKQIEIQKLLETNLQTLENRCELLELQNDQIRHEKEKLQNMLNAKVPPQPKDVSRERVPRHVSHKSITSPTF